MRTSSVLSELVFRACVVLTILYFAIAFEAILL